MADRAQREGCALVTGASRGIGAAIARALAARRLAGRRQLPRRQRPAETVVAEIERDGGRAIAARRRRRRPQRSRRAVRGARARASAPVLVLVNNAGISRDDLTPVAGRRGMGCGARHQPERRVPPDASRAEADAARALRADRQHLLGRRPARQRRAGQLRGGQGGPDRADEDGRGRGRPPRSHRQRGRARAGSTPT